MRNVTYLIYANIKHNKQVIKMYELIITKKMLATPLPKQKIKGGKKKFDSMEDFRNYEKQKFKIWKKLQNGIKLNQLNKEELKFI